jgi:uncharacterized protein (DUF934 family)
VDRIDLHFPKFTDGRAFSQAVSCCAAAWASGEIRATGDVLIDQLVQMQRSGFDSAVLREDQDLAWPAPVRALPASTRAMRSHRAPLSRGVRRPHRRPPRDR